MDNCPQEYARTIALLEEHGFKPMDCLPVEEGLSIFMDCNPTQMIYEAKRLKKLLEDQGLTFPELGADLAEVWDNSDPFIEVGYSPLNDRAVLQLMNVDDSFLFDSSVETVLK